MIAQLINEQTLIDLLSKGDGGGAKIPADLAPFSKSSLQSGWQTWWSSKYGLSDYYVYLPPDKSRDQQFKVKLSLHELQWKLAGIDLPKPMLVQLAHQLVKQRGEKKTGLAATFDSRDSAFLKGFAFRFEGDMRDRREGVQHRANGWVPLAFPTFSGLGLWVGRDGSSVCV